MRMDGPMDGGGKDMGGAMSGDMVKSPENKAAFAAKQGKPVKPGQSKPKDAKLAALGKMLAAKFQTFQEKVDFIKQNAPEVKDPSALVVAALAAAGLAP